MVLSTTGYMNDESIVFSPQIHHQFVLSFVTQLRSIAYIYGAMQNARLLAQHLEKINLDFSQSIKYQTRAKQVFNNKMSIDFFLFLEKQILLYSLQRICTESLIEGSRWGMHTQIKFYQEV